MAWLLKIASYCLLIIVLGSSFINLQALFCCECQQWWFHKRGWWRQTRTVVYNHSGCWLKKINPRGVTRTLSAICLLIQPALEKCLCRAGSQSGSWELGTCPAGSGGAGQRRARWLHPGMVGCCQQDASVVCLGMGPLPWLARQDHHDPIQLITLTPVEIHALCLRHPLGIACPLPTEVFPHLACCSPSCKII